ncbi:hypothetical protein LBMAG56_28880 [Verrucomicrobiota bacterium]|nr:hypothetical protein LBMAG56_28880 [Verrucomicrobiota bacterium]
MQRSGKNQGGYFGETLDIGDVLRRIAATASRCGWRLEHFHHLGTHSLAALHRRSAAPARRIYISAGIHGDEPAGPLAVLQLLEQNDWPADADLWLCPCLNPAGFTLNRRENASGIDLNREYHAPVAPEVLAHTRWLAAQPAFDLALCLHEDWESHGFYLYELNPDQRPSLAEKIIAAVAPVCPIDLSPVIETRPARGGIVRPDVDPLSRPQWPEAFYLLQHKTRLSYTLEAPSDFPLATRTAALATAVKAALENFAAHREAL